MGYAFKKEGFGDFFSGQISARKRRRALISKRRVAMLELLEKLVKIRDEGTIDDRAFEVLKRRITSGFVEIEVVDRVKEMLNEDSSIGRVIEKLSLYDRCTRAASERKTRAESFTISRVRRDLRFKGLL